MSEGHPYHQRRGAGEVEHHDPAVDSAHRTSAHDEHGRKARGGESGPGHPAPVHLVPGSVQGEDQACEGGENREQAVQGEGLRAADPSRNRDDERIGVHDEHRESYRYVLDGRHETVELAAEEQSHQHAAQGGPGRQHGRHAAHREDQRHHSRKGQRARQVDRVHVGAVRVDERHQRNAGRECDRRSEGDGVTGSQGLAGRLLGHPGEVERPTQVAPEKSSELGLAPAPTSHQAVAQRAGQRFGATGCDRVRRSGHFIAVDSACQMAGRKRNSGCTRLLWPFKFEGKAQ